MNLISLNNPFMQNKSFGDEVNPEVFSYTEKNSTVCLCAPHATKTFIGKPKTVDLYTGAITKYIGEGHNYSYVVCNKYMPRKFSVSDFIVNNQLENHFFLDIHGMTDGTGFDLAVGTGYLPEQCYEKELANIHRLAELFSLNYVVNDRNYAGTQGLTGRLQQTTGMANVLQLEWSARYRDIFDDSARVTTVTLPFITALAQLIEHEYSKNRLFNLKKYEWLKAKKTR